MDQDFSKEDWFVIDAALQKVTTSIRKIEAEERAATAKKPSNISLVCVSCGKSTALTESEARVWRNSEEKLGVVPYCACGGVVKLSTTSP